MSASGMADYRNPMYAAEPYQESQGSETPASPDDLAAFYRDMEKKEMLERKLSKRKSNSGVSLWSRKSVKRSQTAPSVPPAADKPTLRQSLSNVNDKSRRGEEEREMEKLEERKDGADSITQLNSPRSIVPDTLKDIPAWYQKDVWASVPLANISVKYAIHNPVGPRWYKNHHLIPPSQRSAIRPPSFFSPSFPHMATSNVQDTTEDMPRLPGPSRTPSNSPLPTPSSSQTRVVDPASKPRSRKNSQTAHDNVDLLDVSDPWGTNWHHQSPYDIGLSNEPVSAQVQDTLHTRSRRASVTVSQTRHKSVVPSPLSQSTSAVHLHGTEVPRIDLPRKLSKRRTPAVGNLFNSQPPQDAEQKSTSLPATPIESQTSADNAPTKRSSLAPPAPSIMTASTHTSGKKDKRTSVLGRLVKKFSLLRKPAVEPQLVEPVIEEHQWQQVNLTAREQPGSNETPDVDRSSEKPQPVEPMKRIPPPSFKPPSLDENDREIDRSSFISLEAPFSMGKLTITNPDSPASGSETPNLSEAPLPPEKSPPPERGGQYPLIISSPLVSDPSPRTVVRASHVSSSNKSLPDLTRLVREPDMATSPTEKSAVESTPSPPRHNHDAPPTTPPEKPRSPTTSARPSNVSNTRTQPSGRKSHSNAHAESPKASSKRKTDTSNEHTHHKDHPSQLVLPHYTTERPTSYPASPVPFPSPSGPAAVVVDSPLSTASLVVHPPTPYNNVELSIAPPHETAPAIATSAPETANDRGTTRRTETFKLVRSSSGNVYASSETIVAAGQQWEVVESAKHTSKSRGHAKSKESKEPQTSSRRERVKKDSKPRVDADAEYVRASARNHKNLKESPSDRIAESRRTTNNESRDQRNTVSAQAESSRIHHKHAEDQERKFGSSGHRTTQPQTSHAQPVERRPSVSVRPTSELPSTADLNALRAREAWEMERLWKARSMTGQDMNGFATISTPSETPLTLKHDMSNGVNHGSSHTAYVVPNPFQSNGSHIYHSMPTVPPPIVYPSAHAEPQPVSPQRSVADSLSSEPALSRMSLFNPLPAPPRESSYEPEPLPSLLDPSNPRSAEYLTKYTGVTIAH